MNSSGKMRNILLTLSYDGTDFCGWQRQDLPSDLTPGISGVDFAGGQVTEGSGPDGLRQRQEPAQAQRTVQGEIERALEKIHRQKTLLYGSGRTDSGVHALGQAANFFSPIPTMPAQNYVEALNAFLPQDIRILEAREVAEDFSARKSATSRVYRYFISYGRTLPANNTRYTWFVKKYIPNLQRLNHFCTCLHGEIDCASFAAADDQSLSTYRYIDGARFFLQKDLWGNDLLVFEIEANAFLWKMVRTLIGTLVNLDKSGGPLDSMEKILAACDRTKAGVTAPPTGLFLYKIKFDGIRRHV